jgi:ribosome-associated toxin RatA of RatAB toxin-antitoxin module
MEAELTVAFLAFTERYTSRVTCVPYESVKVRFPFSILFIGLCKIRLLIDFSFWVVLSVFVVMS